MLECIKVTLLASLNGYAPALAVEFGRKVLYSTERPAFAELEKHVKRKTKAAERKPRRSSRAWPTKPPRPIIIKRNKKAAGGHHGGAWKIAYADFVTAMMAFFLLMWLLGSTTQGRSARVSPTISRRRSRSRSPAAPARATLEHHPRRRQGPVRAARARCASATARTSGKRSTCKRRTPRSRAAKPRSWSA